MKKMSQYLLLQVLHVGFYDFSHYNVIHPANLSLSSIGVYDYCHYNIIHPLITSPFKMYSFLKNHVLNTNFEFIKHMKEEKIMPLTRSIKLLIVICKSPLIYMFDPLKEE
jgi:hypothetical protein